MGFFAKIIDSTIASISPERGAARQKARLQSKFLADSTGVGSYYGPYSQASGNRTSSSWFYSPKDPEFRYISQVGQRSMRDRARTLQTSNEIAKGLLETTVSNVVGPKGFQLQVTADNPAWTPEHNQQWRSQAQKLMDQWFTKADIGGLTWIQHQKMVFRSCLRDGDVGVILDNDGYLQGIEADLIADPDDKYVPEGANVIFGVEVDKYNNPQAYYVTPLVIDKDEKPESIRVAEQDFVFISNVTRFGQLRGETIFATVFDLCDQISKWKQATLMAAMIGACFGVAITRNDGGAPVIGDAANASTNGAGQQQAQMSLEPGSIQYLNPGESIEPINPAMPGHNFPANLTAMLRLAGIPFGLPLELVLLDYSHTNFSSARASLQTAYRTFEAWQQFFIDRYLKRVYQWRISKFIKAGLLEPHPEPWQHRWISEPWPFLDPVKEMQAIQMSLDIGTNTLKSVLQGQGKDITAHLKERGDELKAMAENGVPQYYSQGLQAFGATPKTGGDQLNQSAPIAPDQTDDEPLDDGQTVDDLEGENTND